MFFNPELRRNIWLDFSWHRLILTPIFIGLMTYVYYLITNIKEGASLAFNIGCFFVFLWGTKNASETVIDEVNNNTWDLQRQSAISPWSMAWGKLIGSTLFSWYGAGLALMIYLLLSANTSSNVFAFALPNSSQFTLSHKILIIILGGLFGQALALLLSLQVLSQVRREHNIKTFRYFLVGTFVSIFVTSVCFQSAKHGTLPIHWYQMSFAVGTFTLVSLMLFLGWAILGLQRSFSKELQYQNIPWAWLGFNLFCMIYFSGLASIQELPISYSMQINPFGMKDVQQLIYHFPYYTAFLIAQLLTYLAVFTDMINTVRYKKLLARLQENNFIETLQQLPWWCISFSLTIVAGILIIVQRTQLDTPIGNFSLPTLVITSLLFLFRDILLVHYFHFSKNPKRALSASLLYLFLLYLLIPLMLSLLHLSHLLPIFVPSWGQNTALALLSTFGQIAVLGGLCWKKWQMSWKAI